MTYIKIVFVNVYVIPLIWYFSNITLESFNNPAKKF